MVHTPDELLANPDLRGPYPRQVLEHARNALVLFGCALNGENDGSWIAGAGIPTVCVDIVGERTGGMRGAYPDDWEFVVADAFEWVKHTSDRFDLVSVDPPSNLSAAAADHLTEWLRVTNQTLVLGMQFETMNRAHVPAGWMVSETVRRSAVSVWLVLERA